MGDVRIRPARGSDLARVREVEVESFTVPWGEGSFRSLLGLSRVFFLVAELDGRVVGHGILWWMADEGELANLAVHPSARGSGVAGVLLDSLLEEAREVGLGHVYLEVRMSNEVAYRLYRSRGFRDVGVRKDYYRRPREDARVLRLDLPPTGTPARARTAAGTPPPPDHPNDHPNPTTS